MDSLVLLEEMFQEFGRLDGLRDGTDLGLTEGKMLGIDMGWKIGRELGFLKGCAQILLNHIINNPQKYSERHAQKLKSFATKLDSFPLYNDLNSIDPNILIDRVRRRFKALKLAFLTHDDDFDEFSFTKPDLSF